MTTTAATIREAMVGAWEPRPALTVSQWADRYRTIVGRGSSEPGKWRTDRAPYLRGIMDAFNDPRVRRISVIKSTRMGVTEALINILGYIVDYAPAPTMWVYPNDKIAQKVNTDRLLPTLRQCPKIAAHFTDNKHDQSVMEVRFDRMTLRFSGSNSPANLESFGYKVLIVDELDRCEPTLLSQIESRTDEFADHKIIAISSPTLEEEGIHRQVYGAADRTGSDQRQYYVPCPHCGEYHTRHFANVGWDGGLAADPDKVKSEAWITCPKCGAVIEAYDNLWQLQRGVWLKRGQRIDPDGTIHDTEESLALPRDHAGFILNGLYFPFGSGNPYGRVASRFVAAKGRPDQEWVNRTLGEAWSQKGDRLEVREVRKLCVPSSNGGYRLRQCPAGCLVLTLATDIQTDRVYVEVRGWSAGGRESWLVDHVELPSSEGDGLIGLETWLVEKAGAYGAPIGGRFIDSGDRTQEVYNLIRRLRARGVSAIPVKGYFRATDARPHFWGWTEKGPDGKPTRSSLRLLNINTDFWKSYVLSRLKPPIPHASTAEMEDAGASWHFPEDTADEYLDQLTAEHRVKKQMPGGRIEHVWQKRPGRLDNHYFDCAVYNAAGADALGVRNLQPPGDAAAPTERSEPAEKPQQARRGAVSERVARARMSPLVERMRERRGLR